MFGNEAGLDHHRRCIDISHSANVHNIAQFIDSMLKGKKANVSVVCLFVVF